MSNLKKVNVETVKMHIGKKKGMIELLHFHSHKRKNKDHKYNISKIGISHFAVTVNNLDKLSKIFFHTHSSYSSNHFPRLYKGLYH